MSRNEVVHDWANASSIDCVRGRSNIFAGASRFLALEMTARRVYGYGFHVERICNGCRISETQGGALGCAGFFVWPGIDRGGLFESIGNGSAAPSAFG
jgi:hypothetical protein